MRMATGLAMLTARWSRAPAVSWGTRRRKCAPGRRCVVVDGGDVERPGVALPPVRGSEPGGRHVGLAERSRTTSVPAAMSPSRWSRGDSSTDTTATKPIGIEEEVDEPHGGPQERLLEPHGGAVGADHPQPHRRLAQGAPVPQRLERAEPRDDHAQAGEDGDQGAPVPSAAVAQHGTTTTRSTDDHDDRQRQGVDGEGDGARRPPARSKSRTTASGVTMGWTAGACHRAARYTRPRWGSFAAPWTSTASSPATSPHLGTGSTSCRRGPVEAGSGLAPAEVDELVDTYQRVSSHLSHARWAYATRR